MKVIALKTFKNRSLGLFRTDRSYDVPDKIASELIKAGLMVANTYTMESPENKALPSVPEVAGPLEGGQDLVSSASRRVRRSAKPTATKSTNGRRKKTTDE